jgi:hypothetical protein
MKTLHGQVTDFNEQENECKQREEEEEMQHGQVNYINEEEDPLQQPRDDVINAGAIATCYNSYHLQLLLPTHLLKSLFSPPSHNTHHVFPQLPFCTPFTQFQC